MINRGRQSIVSDAESASSCTPRLTRLPPLPFFARWLSWELSRLRLTEQELALRLGIDPSQVSRFVTATAIPSRERDEQIRRVLALAERYPERVNLQKYPLERRAHDCVLRPGYPLVHLDRLAVVFTRRDRAAFERFAFEKFGEDAFDKRTLRYAFVLHSKKQGFRLEFAPRTAKRSFVRVEIIHPEQRDPSQSFMLHAVAILRRLVLPFVSTRDVWVSRLDIAVDYPVRIAAFEFLALNTLEFAEYHSNGVLTGCSFGSRKSGLFIRPYDLRWKRVFKHGDVTATSHPMTRVEAEIRPAKQKRRMRLLDLCLLADPFSGIPLFEVCDLPADEYSLLVETARHRGLTLVGGRLPRCERRTLAKRLTIAHEVAGYPSPSLAFAERWRGYVREFLRHLRAAEP